MKSFLILLILYILMFSYGRSIPTLKKSDKKPLLSFNQNKIIISSNNDSKNIELNCEELNIDSEKESKFKKLEAHIRKDTNLKTKDSQRDILIKEDIFIRAEDGYYNLENKTVKLLTKFDITYGVDTYLKSSEADWDINNQLITIPYSFFLQKGANVFQGEDGTLNIATSSIIFKKNIIGKLNNSRWGKPEIIVLKSKGPLTYLEKEKTIDLKDLTTMDSDQYQLSAGSLKIILNQKKQIQTIEANDRVRLIIKNKKINAQAEQAVIHYEKGTYELLTKDGIEPFIDINGFRQTANRIEYNEKSDTLVAGPTVKSIKLPEDQ